jgi:hypothetical protein
MNHYITVIRKSDFTDLFKFGYQYVNNDRLIEFDGDVSSLPNNMAITEKLFSEVNPFEYTFTMLLIHIEADLRSNGLVYIEDVRNIYPLDLEAKREIENSFDERIRIENPLWPDFTASIQKQFLYEGAKKGASNIWNILKIKQPINSVSEILPDTDLKELSHEVFTASKAHGGWSFWFYLLRYQRHGYFPKNSIGYFMDLINVFINFKNKQELPAENVETTNIFHELETLSASNKQLSVKDIIEILGETENGRNFFSAIQDAATNNNAVIIAVLFLVFKNTFIDGFKLDKSAKKILDYSAKEFPEGVNYALYLLGIFLGNDHTFECLYETLPLAIFKDKKLEPQECKPLPKEPTTPEGTQNTNNLFGFPEPKRQFPIKMKKDGKGKARTAKNESQYQKNIKDGYQPINS